MEITERLASDFSKYGMELADFFINSITPPPEVQKMIDERSGLQAVGNLDSFFKFKAAKAMGDAASGGGDGMGGAAGAAAGGMGVGVGAGLGMMLPGMLARSVTETAPAQGEKLKCPRCHNEVSSESRFCNNCGAQLVTMNRCPECKAELPPEAKFCSNCGKELGETLACPHCGTELPPGTRFCTNCGEKLKD